MSRETCAGVFNPEFFWNRISRGGVSVFDISPTGYDRLAQYFDEHIDVLPSAEKEKYIRGMIEARVAGVSGSLLPPHTQKRWNELRRGKPLLNLYGSTEVTLICSMRWEDPVYPDMVTSRCPNHYSQETKRILVLNRTTSIGSRGEANRWGDVS